MLPAPETETSPARQNSSRAVTIRRSLAGNCLLLHDATQGMRSAARHDVGRACAAGALKPHAPWVLPNGGPPPARRTSSRTPRMWVPLDLSDNATVSDRSIQDSPTSALSMILAFVTVARSHNRRQKSSAARSAAPPCGSLHTPRGCRRRIRLLLPR
jgi:hypothetical protein